MDSVLELIVSRRAIMWEMIAHLLITMQGFELTKE